MDSVFVPLGSLPARFENAIVSIPLWPQFLDEDYAEYSKRYVERATDASWRPTRIEQRAEVDTLIRNILAIDTSEQRESLLRRTQNETLLFYYERIQLVRHALVHQANDYPPQMGIPAQESWNSFWQALLLNMGKVCDDVEQNNRT